MIANEEHHTTPRQRIAIVLITLLTLGSTFALYASAVINYGGNSSKSTTVDESATTALAETVQTRTDLLSDQYFSEFSSYKSRAKAFNAVDVTAVKTADLKIGTGAEITDSEFTDYFAYYIGWLADETIFDSSFDNADSPTSLGLPLVGTSNMIEGWKQGIVGMKFGGVREISIPAALAYGDTEQGTIPAGSPLKFVIMLIEPDDELLSAYNQLVSGS